MALEFDQSLLVVVVLIWFFLDTVSIHALQSAMVAPGRRDKYKASTPVTWGVAIEVPLILQTRWLRSLAVFLPHIYGAELNDDSFDVPEVMSEPGEITSTPGPRSL